jgi:hypothetical protein
MQNVGSGVRGGDHGLVQVDANGERFIVVDGVMLPAVDVFHDDVEDDASLSGWYATMPLENGAALVLHVPDDGPELLMLFTSGARHLPAYVEEGHIRPTGGAMRTVIGLPPLTDIEALLDDEQWTHEPTDVDEVIRYRTLTAALPIMAMEPADR